MQVARMLMSLSVVGATATLVACAPPPAGPSVEDQTKAAVKYAVELRVEQVPLVELKFKKEEFSLDIDKHIDNAMAAEHASIPVGMSTYNEWQVGQELSRSGMGVNIVLTGELSEYVVSVNKKWIETHWLYLDSKNQPHEIDQTAYDAALKQLPQANLKSVETANGKVTFILKKPVSQLEFTSVTPLTRYFVTVEIGNESFTTDLEKLLRDALSKHRVELEVPKQVYEGGEVWDARLSEYTFFVKGRWQEIHGHIVDRRTITDNNYVEATTTKGRTLVLPASEVG
jgi:hypothetical protein